MVMPFGLLAMLFAPFVGRGIQLYDVRIIASTGFVIFAAVSFMRAGFDLTADPWAIALPAFVQGAANVMFFLPLTALALSGLPPERIPAATGLNNFMRFTFGAFGASAGVTLWDDRTRLHRAHLVEHVTAYDPATDQTLAALQSAGMDAEQALAQLERMVDAQARMIGTIDIFWLSGWMFIGLAALVWVARPARAGGGASVQAKEAAAG